MGSREKLVSESSIGAEGSVEINQAKKAERAFQPDSRAEL